MRVEVVNTGSELLLGLVVNTHLGFLAEQLGTLGLRIARQTTLQDGLGIRDAMVEVAARSDIVLVTGGLGPTNDDVTREAVADAFGCVLLRDDHLLEGLRRRFAERGIEIDQHIERQAMVPVGAEVLPNPHGTAPGLYFPPVGTPHRPAVFLLPGPPRELHPMVRDYVLPKLQSMMTEATLPVHHTLKLTGIGESQVEASVGEQIEALPGIEVGYCARPGEVDVRLIGPPDSVAAASRLVSQALGDYVFSDAGASLESVVVGMLRKQGKTLAVVESCTGGLLAHRITNIPGASDIFLAGLVTYANATKVQFAGVPEETIARHGAVSREVAIAMASGALGQTGADFTLSTTGIAGPGGGTEAKPVGTVYLGLAGREIEPTATHHHFRTDRETFKQLATQSALDMLRRHLAGPL